MSKFYAELWRERINEARTERKAFEPAWLAALKRAAKKADGLLKEGT